MKISGLTIRQIAIDAAPRYGAEGIPPGRPAAWHYPLVALHTDEGIDGHTMGYGNQGDGRAIACLMRDVFGPKIRGEDPFAIERLWLRLRRANRDLYALSDAMSGMNDVALWDILGKVRNAPICDLLGRVLDEIDFTWFEEPIPDRQTGILRRLADEWKTPILGGETVTLDELAEQVRVRAYDLARGDVYLKAGISGLMKAFHLCELQGLQLEVHTMATPLLDVANLHCNLTAKNGGCAEVIHPISRFGLKGRPLDIEADGWLHAPTGPGLGVELDWDWIDNHTVERIEVQ